jgi:HEAT repeat protein
MTSSSYRNSVVLLAIAAALGVMTGCNSEPKAGKDPTALNRPVPKAPDYPPAHQELANAALRSKARSLILAASSSQNPLVRAHAIEAYRQAAPDIGKDNILNAIADPSRLVRFSALVAAGELRITEAYGPALALVKSEDPTIALAATFCVHRLGDKRFSHRFEKAASDPDRLVRANTALLLGMIGEPSAARVLEFQLKDLDTAVRLQAAEGLWRMRNEAALEPLVSATISRYPDDQMIAALALAAPRDPRVAEHLRGLLTTSYPEVNLVAARALGMIGNDGGYGVAMQYDRGDDPRQRQLAAMAFGAIGRMDAQTRLGKMLEDGNEDVRLAAASAILQLHN